jgi:hypothetical protein
MSSTAVHVIHVPSPFADEPKARSHFVMEALQNNQMKRRKCLPPPHHHDAAPPRCFVTHNVVEFGTDFRTMYSCDPYRIMDVITRRSVLNSTS